MNNCNTMIEHNKNLGECKGKIREDKIQAKVRELLKEYKNIDGIVGDAFLVWFQDYCIGASGATTKKKKKQKGVTS